MAINREQGLLTELLVTGDMVSVVDKSINASYFTGRYKKAFKFIQEFQSKYGKMPSIEVFLQKNPNIELSKVDNKYGTGEKIQYWCDEVRAKKKHNTIADSLDTVVTLINEEKDADKAYEELKRLVLRVENEIVFSARMKINENTKKRKEEYKKRQKSGGMTGIPSFITHWDSILGGYNKGELYTFMGYTGVGKSWLEIIQAVMQAKEGYRVLFITTEMSDKLVFRRIDAVWCGLNYSDFKKGQLKPEQEKKYFKYLDDMENTPDEDVMLVVEQATGGLSQISAKIDQYDPDIVYVDGAYLLEDEEGEEDNWAGVTRVWRGFHRLCLSKDKPIILTTQSKDETGASLKSMAFARAIANECDVVAVIEQEEQMKNDKEAKLKPLKLREGDNLSSVMMNWDFDNMKYNSIFKEKVVEQTKVENVQGVITIK
jgi:archaellum biogenesis ATPase FlaH